MTDAAPNLRVQEGAPVPAPLRGQRGIRGFYPMSQRGRLAADGSLLDRAYADEEYVVASAWNDPACEHLRCWRPEKLGMVPPGLRACRAHGRPTPPAEDPFPLEGQELAAAKGRAWDALAAKYGVPIIYHDMSTWIATPALEAALAFADDDGPYSMRGVVLEGRPGCGKTSALYAALRAFALDMVQHDRKDDLRFYTFPQLSRLLLDEDERDETLEGLCEADELFLDDLGAGFTKPSGFVVSCIEEALQHREAHRYPALMSTNLDPKRFRALFGERLFDRLRGEWGVWISVDRPSLRQKKGTAAR